jgi:dimethylargininase
VEFTGVLHLKTALNELAPGVCVLAGDMQTDYDLSFTEIVNIPAEEAYAANMIPINDTLLMASGFPKTLELAGKYYADDQIIPLAMSEFQKMDGGLSCLSLRY